MDRELLVESPVVSNTLGDDFIFHDNVDELFSIYQRIIKEFNSDTYENQYETNNVVGIVGKRGSGKTSFMLSVMKALREGTEKNGFSSKSIFVVSTLIEPRFFNEENNILRLIVAKLFSIYKKDYSRNPAIDSEELNSCFVCLSALTDYLVPNSSTSVDEMGALDQLSNCLEIKEKLKELFDNFIDYENKVNKDKDFKTIAFFIDDLDLDSGNAYKMISDISKYLKVKGIIITLAYDEATMDNLIFLEKMNEFGLPKKNESENGWEKYLYIDLQTCKENSTQYLLKLIPMDYQVNLRPERNNEKVIQLIFSVLLENENPDLNACKSYPDFYNVLANINDLRLENQAFNLILGAIDDPKVSLPSAFGDKAVDPNFETKFLKAIALLMNVNNERINPEGFDISLAMFSPKNDKAVSFYYQCCLILLYYGKKSIDSSLSFGQFLMDSGVSVLNNEAMIFATKSKIDPNHINLLDCSAKYNLEPLAFFELISKIDCLKESTMKGSSLTKKYLHIIQSYFSNKEAISFIINNTKEDDIIYLMQLHKSKIKKETSKRSKPKKKEDSLEIIKKA